MDNLQTLVQSTIQLYDTMGHTNTQSILYSCSVFAAASTIVLLDTMTSTLCRCVALADSSVETGS